MILKRRRRRRRKKAVRLLENFNGYWNQWKKIHKLWKKQKYITTVEIKVRKKY